jgi:hypothetical protein
MSGSKMQSRVSFAVESVDGVDGAHVQQPHHHLVIPTEGEREGESQCEGTRGEGGREGSRLGGEHQRGALQATSESEDRGSEYSSRGGRVSPVDVNLTSREPLAELH